MPDRCSQGHVNPHWYNFDSELFCEVCIRNHFEICKIGKKVEA